MAIYDSYTRTNKIAMAAEVCQYGFSRTGFKKNRGELLRLADISTPSNGSRRKSKLNIKTRSHSNVRDRIHDDPAYTHDISHLAFQSRRNSGPEQINLEAIKNKSKINEKLKREKDFQSLELLNSSSSNNSLDSDKIMSEHYMEGSTVAKNVAINFKKSKYKSMQEFNISLEKTSKSMQESAENTVNKDFSHSRIKSQANTCANAAECLTCTRSLNSAENKNLHSEDRKERNSKKVLKEGIGIKSFNYYLLKEGLASSHKLTPQGEEKTSSKKDALGTLMSERESQRIAYNNHSSCNDCMCQIPKQKCDYFYPGGAYQGLQKPHDDASDDCPIAKASRNTHVLRYHSYNPNNPGIYKIETTPITFAGDYNAICCLRAGIQAPQSQGQYLQEVSTPNHKSRKGTHFKTVTKSSSSTDLLQFKYEGDQSSQNSKKQYQRLHPNFSKSFQASNNCNQILYKSNSRDSVISEYSFQSESSTNCNLFHGEISDSSLEDSKYSAQRRLFGSSESCRFGFECRRCSLDAEKYTLSDTCRYECGTCECTSNYFSSDFDDSNYNEVATNKQLSSIYAQPTAQRRTYAYYDDTFEIKPKKYAQSPATLSDNTRSKLSCQELQRTPGVNELETHDTRLVSKYMAASKSTKDGHLFSHIEAVSESKVGNQSSLNALIRNNSGVRPIGADKKAKTITQPTQNAEVFPINSVSDYINNEKGTSLAKFKSIDYKKNTGTIPKLFRAAPVDQPTPCIVPKSDEKLEGQTLQKVPMRNINFSQMASVNSPQTNIPATLDTSISAAEIETQGQMKNQESSIQIQKPVKHLLRQNKEISADNSFKEIHSKLNATKESFTALEASQVQQTNAKAETIQRSPIQEHKARSTLSAPLQTSHLNESDDEVFLDESKQSSDKQSIKAKSKVFSRRRFYAFPAVSKKTKTEQQHFSQQNISGNNDFREADDIPPLQTSILTGHSRRREDTIVCQSSPKKNTIERKPLRKNISQKIIEHPPPSTSVIIQSRSPTLGSDQSKTKFGTVQTSGTEQPDKVNGQTSSQISTISFNSENNCKENFRSEGIQHISEGSTINTDQPATHISDIGLNKIDIRDFPLPELPSKEKRKEISASTSKTKAQSIEEDPKRKSISYNDRQRSLPRTKGDFQKFHVRNDFRSKHNRISETASIPALADDMCIPTFASNNDISSDIKELWGNNYIYLNQSGWVQVNSKPYINKPFSQKVINDLEDSSENRKEKSKPKYNRLTNITASDIMKRRFNTPSLYGSKSEDLLISDIGQRYQLSRANYGAINLNKRPVVLPVNVPNEAGSSLPATPILSPPPAFQDSKSNSRTAKNDRNLNVKTTLFKTNGQPNSRGVVFSRSFEYGKKQPPENSDFFSKSFDGDLSSCQINDSSNDLTKLYESMLKRSSNDVKRKKSQNRDSSQNYIQPRKAFGDVSLDSDRKTRIATTKSNENHSGKIVDAFELNRTYSTIPIPTSSSRNIERIYKHHSPHYRDPRFDVPNNETTRFTSKNYQSLTTSQNSYRPSNKQEKCADNAYQTKVQNLNLLALKSRYYVADDRPTLRIIRQNTEPWTNKFDAIYANKNKFQSQSRSSSSSSSYSGGERDLGPSRRRSCSRQKREENRARRSRSLQSKKHTRIKQLRGRLQNL